MLRDAPSKLPENGRVLPFRQRAEHPYAVGRGSPQPKNQAPGRSPVEDVGKYERPEADHDDYRHRMMVNVAGFVVCALLIGVGIWLAIKIADLRRDQDCVLSGRRNCAQISIVGS